MCTQRDLKLVPISAYRGRGRNNNESQAARNNKRTSFFGVLIRRDALLSFLLQGRALTTQPVPLRGTCRQSGLQLVHLERQAVPLIHRPGPPVLGRCQASPILTPRPLQKEWASIRQHVTHGWLARPYRWPWSSAAPLGRHSRNAAAVPLRPAAAATAPRRAWPSSRPPPRLPIVKFETAEGIHTKIGRLKVKLQ